MGGSKSKKIKLQIVIALSVVFAVMAYFRFVHSKMADVSGQRPSNTAIPQAQIPHVDIESLKNPIRPDSLAEGALGIVFRDIFLPPNLPVLALEKPEEPDLKENGPGMILTGTITGGSRAMAIINDQFLQVGDLIGEFCVISIEKNRVVVASGNETISLETIPNG